MPIELRKTQYAIRGWGGNGFQPGDTSGPWIVAVWYIICYSKASLVCLGIFLPQTLEANVREQLRLLKFRRRKEEQFEKKKEKKESRGNPPRCVTVCTFIYHRCHLQILCNSTESMRKKAGSFDFLTFSSALVFVPRVEPLFAPRTLFDATSSRPAIARQLHSIIFVPCTSSFFSFSPFFLYLSSLNSSPHFVGLLLAQCHI